jgi:hypothetical protein
MPTEIYPLLVTDRYDWSTFASSPYPHEVTLPKLRDLFPGMITYSTVLILRAHDARLEIMLPLEHRERQLHPRRYLPPLKTHDQDQAVVDADFSPSPIYTATVTPVPSSPMSPHDAIASNTSSPKISEHPLAFVHASASVGPAACSFDILRPDPVSSSLQHVASSQTRWTAIPRLPVTDNAPLLPDSASKGKKSRRVYYAPGLNPLVESARASLASARQRSSSDVTEAASLSPTQHIFAVSPPTLSSSALSASCGLLDTSAGDTSIRWGWQLSMDPSPFAYGPLPPMNASRGGVSGPESSGRSSTDRFMDAAAAQAEFEAELHVSAHRKASIGSSSNRDSTPLRGRPSTSSAQRSSPSSSSVSASGITVAGWNKNKRSAANTDSSSQKKKKPCDTDRKHVCPRCGRAFNRPSSLRVHGHAHTGFRRMFSYMCGSMCRS